MNEKKLAKILKQSANYIEENNFQSHIPVSLNKEISNCNFELLQQECDNLGFHICKMEETPFDTKFYKSVSKEKNSRYVVYTDKSIYNHN